MSGIDTESQDSVEPESSEYDEDEDDDDYYYYNNGDEDEGMASDKEDDPEAFEFQIIDPNEAQEVFDALVAKISQEIKVKSLRKLVYAYENCSAIPSLTKIAISNTGRISISVLLTILLVSWIYNQVSESVSRILLMQHDWNTEKILER